MKKIVVALLACCLSIPMTAKGISEQEFVDFLATLPTLPSMHDGRSKVDSMMGNVEARELDTVLDWAAKYLLDDRSPLCNPPLYDSLFVMDAAGHKPMDFAYKDTLGNKSTLYSTALPDTTLAFFYSADCDHCMGTLREWHENRASMPAALRKAHVLAVCLNSDDETLWRQSLPLLPKGWTPVLDLSNLIVHRRYDLRSLPHTVTVIDGLIVEDNLHNLYNF